MTSPDLIRLRDTDDVAITRRDLPAGSEVMPGVTTREDVPRGHKIAVRALPASAPVHRYGQIIGFAGRDIAAGEHVHLHNLEYREFERAYEFCVDARDEEILPVAQQATFAGFRRTPTAASAPAISWAS
ncbi:UxaA family hydrolase [Fodinicola feengrottensis]|uniref:UxaA family hydrolase n=1 Tax=Fodinicola feengrottensis TaxID=435914 RepID=UPI00244368FF|nr:UxaA family hydrolase [Fodinicola feengrottensis]